MLFYAAIVLLGVSIFVVANTLFTDEFKFKASAALEDVDSTVDEKTKNAGLVLKYSRPFFRRYVSPIVSTMKNKKKIREKYRRKLASAGLTQVLTPDDFFAFKLFLIIGFPGLYLMLNEFMTAGWPLIYTPFIAVLGFFYPNIWLDGRIKKRQESVIKSMPFIVDMLALSVEAGLDFLAAMSKVVERAPQGALTEEFEILIKEIKIGSPRAEALRNLAWRINVLPVSSFSAALIAADSVGASIGPILKGLARELREKKSAKAEEAGAKAATKIILPIILLIVPSVFCVIIAAMLLELIQGN